MSGETGSVLTDNTSAVIAATYPYTIKPAVVATVTLQPLDAVVAAKVGRTAGEKILALGSKN